MGFGEVVAGPALGVVVIIAGVSRGEAQGQGDHIGNRARFGARPGGVGHLGEIADQVTGAGGRRFCPLVAPPHELDGFLVAGGHGELEHAEQVNGVGVEVLFGQEFAIGPVLIHGVFHVAHHLLAELAGRDVPGEPVKFAQALRQAGTDLASQDVDRHGGLR